MAEAGKTDRGDANTSDREYIETVLGFSGCHRVRFVGVDFGPANTAIVLVEVRGMPPTHDPAKALRDMNRRIDIMFQEAAGAGNAHGGGGGGEQEPWVTILVAYKYNLKEGRHFMYVDPDFQREFENFSVPVVTPPKFAAPFDARRPGGARGDVAKEEEEEPARPAKRKKRAVEDPGFPLYPRIDALRGTDNDAHGGMYERCSRNWGKFLASQHMLWLFASRWPVVCENQVDHIGSVPSNRGTHHAHSKRREPYNWAESHSFIAALAALDEVYSGHAQRGGATQYPRLVCYVASKYGLDATIKFRFPDYQSKTEQVQKTVRKSLSVEVLKSLPLRKEFFAWYSKLYAESDRGKPKQDDVADAALMAIAAVEKFYRPTKLGTVDQQRHAQIVTQALASEEDRVARDAAAAPHTTTTSQSPPSSAATTTTIGGKKLVVPSKKARRAGSSSHIVRGQSVVRGSSGIVAVASPPKASLRGSIRPIYTDDGDDDNDGGGGAAKRRKYGDDDDDDERALLMPLLASNTVRKSGSGTDSVVLYDRESDGSVIVDTLDDFSQGAVDIRNPKHRAGRSRLSRRFTGPSDDIHAPDYDDYDMYDM